MTTRARHIPAVPAFLAIAAYLLLSVLPAGTAICVGGGHGPGRLLAPACDHGPRPLPTADTKPAVEPCGGCAHHHDDGHDTPCTDISALDELGRVQSSEQLVPPVDTLGQMLPWLDDRAAASGGTCLPTTRAGCSRAARPPDTGTIVALRTVIQLV